MAKRRAHQSLFLTCGVGIKLQASSTKLKPHALRNENSKSRGKALECAETDPSR